VIFLFLLFFLLSFSSFRCITVIIIEILMQSTFLKAYIGAASERTCIFQLALSCRFKVLTVTTLPLLTVMCHQLPCIWCSQRHSDWGDSVLEMEGVKKSRGEMCVSSPSVREIIVIRTSQTVFSMAVSVIPSIFCTIPVPVRAVWVKHAITIRKILCRIIFL
jgi:hypothetical protein